MKKLVRLISVAAFMILNTNVAMACFCETIKTPKEDLADVDAVLMGKVVSSGKA